MADNASRDQNDVPTLLGVSSVSGNSPVTVYANPSTHRLLVDTSGSVTSGTSTPGTTPASLGLIYIKTDTSKVYISTGTSSSADWTIVN